MTMTVVSTVVDTMMMIIYRTPGEKCGQFCKVCNCSLVTAVLFSLAITLTIIFVPKTTEDLKDVATHFYSPGDSRLLSFSSFFCKGIKVETSSTATGATIALVNSTPTLANKNSFRISVRRTLRSEQFHVWQYYLYPNSNVSVNACNLRSAPVDVYLVKGNSNANNWGRSPSSDHAGACSLNALNSRPSHTKLMRRTTITFS